MSEEKETSFFKKVIISIKNFEKYPELASKNYKVVLSYLIKLLAIFTIIVSLASIFTLSKEIDSCLEFVKNEVAEFSFKDNQLNIESKIEKQNLSNLINTVIIDTNNITDETLENYKNTLQKNEIGIAFLKDKLLIKTQVTNGIIEYSYSAITDTYKIQEFNKQEMLQYFSGSNLILIYIGIFIFTFIYMFLIYITSIWLDIILLAAFGYVTALLMRMRIKFIAMCKIAIHSLTLPIILNAIVILVETFTNFKIKYFEIMYIGIAYIYIITAILMIKSDIIKNKQELEKIIEEQEKVRQELEKQKEEEERQKEEQKRKKQKDKENENNRKKEKSKEKDKNVGNEPQGENA